MISRTEMMASLRNNAMEHGGSISGLSMDRFAGRHVYILTLPFTGYTADDIRVVKTHGRFSVMSDRAWPRVANFVFDPEYITLGAWTVHAGVFYMALEYTLPERFKTVPHQGPTPVDQFVKQYGELTHDF